MEMVRVCSWFSQTEGGAEKLKNGGLRNLLGGSKAPSPLKGPGKERSGRECVSSQA